MTDQLREAVLATDNDAPAWAVATATQTVKAIGFFDTWSDEDIMDVARALAASLVGKLYEASYVIANGAHYVEGDKVTISLHKYNALRAAVAAMEGK